jgi:murein DD-endopeptidase MepM/ murein hydrolase activator NlpD
MAAVRFTRTLRQGDQGIDVEGVGRALSRAGFMGPLARFVQKPVSVRRTYGIGKTAAVKRLQAKHRLKQTGVYGKREHEKLEPWFDRYAAHLMLDWRPPARIVTPIAAATPPTFLHPTAGLLGNWALDWMAPGGTPVVAVEDCAIVKLSGRNPSLGADQLIGIYGWSIHYRTASGYSYFSTHYGEREPGLEVGQRLYAGDRVGKVGSWPGDPGRSHLHLGVTSPLGPDDAKRRILAVSKAEPL